MGARDYQDVIGGGIIFALGAFIALYAWHSLEIGSPQRMGPGFFPVGVGLFLVLSGAGILLPAFFRKGKLPSLAWRPLLCISASLLAFGLVIPAFGLIPAIVALVVVAARAESGLTLRALLGLAACLCLICDMIFDQILGLGLPMLYWPF